MQPDRLRVGLVISADDDDVGYHGGKQGRPFLVVRVEGDPPHTVWLLARSKSSYEGVFVPKRAAPGLNRDGKFALDPFPASIEDVELADELGMLAEEHLERVLSVMRSNLMDLE
jgi:hypothetical protein